jgi:hypothetical protein
LLPLGTVVGREKTGAELQTKGGWDFDSFVLKMETSVYTSQRMRVVRLEGSGFKDELLLIFHSPIQKAPSLGKPSWVLSHRLGSGSFCLLPTVPCAAPLFWTEFVFAPICLLQDWGPS